jgi:cephalosporin-C deacetylase-like acetyl esterase
MVGGLPDAWFSEPILSPDVARDEVRRRVDAQLVPLPLEKGLTVRVWEARRLAIREALLDILGLRGVWPPPWPLRVQIKGSLRRDGYTIEKLSYESWPGMAVPALLYIPERSPPEKAPGIVSISGHHYRASKAADYVQARNVNLVRRGCVVLSYDYMNCFERHTGGNGDGHDPVPHGGGNDHGISVFSFSERCPTALEILDARRALDVLAARPEVDADRLAFTGESGGSNSTYWVAALDDRVKLSVPVCSVSTFDYWIDKDRNWDWHQRPPGARRVADIGVLLGLHAPRPTLIITSKRRTDDLEFPWVEAERSYRWARRAYELHGAGDKVAHVESPSGHGYQADKRRELYAWVERELLRAPGGIEGDLPVTPEPLETLRVGLPKGNKTYHDVYREWVAAIPVPPAPGTREEVANYAARTRPALARKLGLPAGLEPASVRAVRHAEAGGVRVGFCSIETEPGITIPVAEFRPARAGPLPVVLIVGARTRARGEVESALAAGRAALVVEPRGAGEVDWGGRRTDNAAWFFGRPRVGQEVFDVLRVAGRWRARRDVASISLTGGDRWGKAALFAAALDPKIAALDASLPPTDRAQFEAGGRSALADVPGLLAVGDLPQTAGLIAPRPCTLRVPDIGPYDWTRAGYRALGSDGLTVSEARSP